MNGINGVPIALHTDLGLDAVTFVLVIFTGLLALFTYRLHRDTLALSRETLRGTQDADTHHRESLSPFCVIREPRISSSELNNMRTVFLSFIVHNQGPGPAVRLNVIMTPVGVALTPDGVSVRREPGPLAPDEKTKDLATSGLWPSKGDDDVILVVLEFQSIFETWGTSRWMIRKNLCSMLDYQRTIPLPEATGATQGNSAT